jgi:hypothetical protein
MVNMSDGAKTPTKWMGLSEGVMAGVKMSLA